MVANFFGVEQLYAVTWMVVTGSLGAVDGIG